MAWRLIPALLFLCILLGCAVSDVSTDVSDRNDALKTAERMGYEFSTVSNLEVSFMMKLLSQTESHPVRSVVLMDEDDRLAAMWWEEGDGSASRFRQLKKKLYRIISSSASGIVDENIAQEGYDEIDLLAFTDPNLFEGRLVFARVGERLFEFHVGVDRESEVIEVIWGIAWQLSNVTR